MIKEIVFCSEDVYRYNVDIFRTFFVEKNMLASFFVYDIMG